MYIPGEITDPLKYKSHVDCQTCTSLQIGVIWRHKTTDSILEGWHTSDHNPESLERTKETLLQ